MGDDFESLHRQPPPTLSTFKPTKPINRNHGKGPRIPRSCRKGQVSDSKGWATREEEDPQGPREEENHIHPPFRERYPHWWQAEDEPQPNHINSQFNNECGIGRCLVCLSFDWNGRNDEDGEESTALIRTRTDCMLVKGRASLIEDDGWA